MTPGNRFEQRETLPEKPKYRRWRLLQDFVTHPSRFSFFSALCRGLFHSVPRADSPEAFSSLLHRDLIFYKTFQGPDGDLRLGLAPTVGYSRGSAVVYSLFNRQIEEFFTPWHTESHGGAQKRLARELSEGGLLNVEQEETAEYTRQRKRRRVVMNARWDLHVPDQDMVVEVETGTNQDSQVQRHIESCILNGKHLIFYVPGIVSQDPRPEPLEREDLDDLKGIKKDIEEIRREHVVVKPGTRPAEKIEALKVRTRRPLLYFRRQGGLVWPLEPSGDSREQAVRYINHLTQVLWRTLLTARKLPDSTVDFCYAGELVRSVEISRGRIYMELDRARLRQPLVRTGEAPVTESRRGEKAEVSAEHFFRPVSLATLIKTDRGVRRY